jgi:dTDP-4-dehydrorhamnose reductase
MQKRRMLVTGGSGYLGDWVVRLSKTRWDVTATFFRRQGEQDGVTWRRLDVRDADAVSLLINAVKPDIIVHTAAANPGPEPDYVGVNVRGTRHVAQASARVDARLVHLSTDVIFDGEEAPYVESDAPHPITAYGRSKARAEAEVRASDAEAVMVRTSLIYGWRPRLDRQTRWVLDGLRSGEPPHLFIDEFRCPIWVESLAAALLELAERPTNPTVLHVAGAQRLSRYDFGVRLARFHGVDPATIIPTSSRESGLNRPLDCALDCLRAKALLETPLPGVDDVLGARMPTAPKP